MTAHFAPLSVGRNQNFACKLKLTGFMENKKKYIYSKTINKFKSINKFG